MRRSQEECTPLSGWAECEIPKCPQVFIKEPTRVHKNTQKCWRGGGLSVFCFGDVGLRGGHAMSNTSEAIAAKLFARLPGALVIGSKTEHNNYQAMGSDKIVQPVIGEINDILNFRRVKYNRTHALETMIRTKWLNCLLDTFSIIKRRWRFHVPDVMVLSVEFHFWNIFFLCSKRPLTLSLNGNRCFTVHV